MKKVVIAPDSFKGTLSSVQVCSIVSSAIMKNYPDAQIISIPVADGGEGTAEAFLQAVGGEKVYCKVKSPLGRDIEAYYALLPDKTAVIESALASGLTVEEKNNPLLASSYGTGQLIKAALDSGAQRIFIGIGGSARFWILPRQLHTTARLLSSSVQPSHPLTLLAAHCP